MFNAKVISQDMRNASLGLMVASTIGYFLNQSNLVYCVGLVGFATFIYFFALWLGKT